MGRSGNECRWNVNDPYSRGKKFPRILSLYYHCGTLVDAHGLHTMVCKKARGKIARHHVLNDIIWPAFGAAGIPAFWTRQTRWQTSRRVNGLTTVMSQTNEQTSCHGIKVNPSGRLPSCLCPLAASYVDRAATDAGTVADMAATRKTTEMLDPSSAYRFEPIAVEDLGVFSSTTLNFISELGRRICVSHRRCERDFLIHDLLFLPITGCAVAPALC